MKRATRARGAQIRQCIAMTEWIRTRREPFHIALFAKETFVCRRTAYRWINALAEQGLVERTDRPCPRAEQTAEDLRNDATSFWVAR